MSEQQLDNAKWYDEYARSLDWGAYREDALWKAEVMLSVIPKGRQYDSMLDVGCGSGVAMKVIANTVEAKHGIGVDISQVMLDRATQEQPNARYARFQWMNAEIGLAYANKWFDLVILSDILEHVEHPILLLREAKRVGRAIVVKMPAEKGLRAKSNRGEHGHLHNWDVADVLGHLLVAVGTPQWWIRVDPPTHIRCREWGWMPNMWLRRFTWHLWRSMYRRLYGTYVVAYLEVHGDGNE